MNAQRIRVDADRAYDVVIGRGILSGCGEAIAELNGNYDKIAVISDDVVYGLYGPVVKASLKATGLRAVEFIFPHGEASKSISTLTKAAGFLCDNFITRKSLLIALGGGVAGDLAGFLASVYQRGIDYIQIPTTFLAAIDSSVGGKTAVNIPQGKNLIGSFWQPRLVWCDIDTLKTLDADVFRDGVAEAVKYGCIMDDSLFALMRDGGFDPNLMETISRCVEIKAKIVRLDERDNDIRAILNFGHTLGHGIEKLSGFAISHGKAVAIGMVLASGAGEEAGLTRAGTTGQIIDILRRNGISTECPYPVAEVCSASLGDKKRSGDNIGLILLENLGKAFIHTVAASGLEAFFNAC